MNFTPEESTERRPWIQPPAMLAGVVVLMAALGYLTAGHPSAGQYCELPPDTDLLRVPARTEAAGLLGAAHDRLEPIPVRLVSVDGELGVEVGDRQAMERVAALALLERAGDLPVSVTVSDAVTVEQYLSWTQSGEWSDGVSIAAIRQDPRGSDTSEVGASSISAEVLMGSARVVPSAATWPAMPEPDVSALTDGAERIERHEPSPESLGPAANPWVDAVR